MAGKQQHLDRTAACGGPLLPEKSAVFVAGSSSSSAMCASSCRQDRRTSRHVHECAGGRNDCKTAHAVRWPALLPMPDSMEGAKLGGAPLTLATPAWLPGQMPGHPHDPPQTPADSQQVDLSAQHGWTRALHTEPHPHTRTQGAEHGRLGGRAAAAAANGHLMASHRLPARGERHIPCTTDFQAQLELGRTRCETALAPPSSLSPSPLLVGSNTAPFNTPRCLGAPAARGEACQLRPGVTLCRPAADRAAQRCDCLTKCTQMKETHKSAWRRASKLRASLAAGHFNALETPFFAAWKGLAHCRGPRARTRKAAQLQVGV